MPHAQLAKQAIRELWDILELARLELADALGGELSIDQIRVISYWLSRAWEAGRDYEIHRAAEARATRRIAFDE